MMCYAPKRVDRHKHKVNDIKNVYAVEERFMATIIDHIHSGGEKKEKKKNYANINYRQEERPKKS